MTKLPVRWYIKLTVENEKVLTKFRGNTFCGPREVVCLASTGYWENITNMKSKGHKEITFGQFKTLVLKEVPSEYLIFN